MARVAKVMVGAGAGAGVGAGVGVELEVVPGASSFVSYSLLWILDLRL